ncbi:MAG: hypothetical protein WD423_11760 [Rhodothermales bacterium]
MQFGCLHIPAFPAWAFEHVAPATVSDSSARTDSAARTDSSPGVDVPAPAAPVVVIAAGKVVAFSRRLRSTGIENGIPAERAERLAPKGTLLRHRDAQLEQAAWEDVLHEVNTYTPFLEEDRPGRLYVKPFKGLRDVTARLCARTAVAPHRSTALLGTLRAAEGHVLVVRARHVRAFLDRFAVERLDALHFSEDLIEQLPLFGFDTLGAAAGLAYRHLRAQFGEEGERLYRLLHPNEEDPISLYKPPPSIRRAYEFDHPRSEPGEVLPALEYVLRRAATELKGHGAQRVKITLHDRLRPSVFACRVLPEASSDVRRLFATVKTLLETALETGATVQAVELELGSLRTTQPEQAGLFFQRPSTEKAVRAVCRRYPDVMRRPVAHPEAVFEEDRASLEPIDGGVAPSP